LKAVGAVLELCQGCKGLQRKLKKGIEKDVLGQRQRLEGKWEKLGKSQVLRRN